MLTVREFTVLRLVVDGLCYKEIGVRMHIEVRTVKFHMCKIYEKLGIKAVQKGSGISAVVWWARNGAPDTWAEYVKAASKDFKIQKASKKVVQMKKRKTA